MLGYQFLFFFSCQTLTNVPRWFTTVPSMLSVTTQLVRSHVLVTAVTMETESIAQVIPFFIRGGFESVKV